MIKIKTLLLTSLLLLLNFQIQAFELDKSRAEFDIKFGGWSHHFKNKKYEEEYKNNQGHYYSYNENHTGLGFEVNIPFYHSNHFLRSGIWYMKDSYDFNSIHLGVGYKYRMPLQFIHSIDYSLDLVYASRGVMSIEYEYKDNNFDHLFSHFYTERENVFFPMPQVTFNITKRFHVDFIGTISRKLYYNQYREENKFWNTVLFVRMGVKF